MESNFLTAVFLPLALFIIMLGMGLGLTTADFKRIAIAPKSVVIGLLAQLVMLPAVGFLLASIFPLSPELAVGVIILAACPGGPTSNNAAKQFNDGHSSGYLCATHVCYRWTFCAMGKRQTEHSRCLKAC